MFLVSYQSIRKTIPDFSLSRHAIFHVPLTRCKTMNIAQHIRNRYKFLHSEQKMIMICQNNPGNNIYANFQKTLQQKKFKITASFLIRQDMFVFVICSGD